MTDAEYEYEKGRLDRLSKKWLAPLGLRWWKVEIVYEREGLESGENGWAVIAQTSVKWHYLDARIAFNMPSLVDMPDDKLENHFVHELCHVLVNEMREPDDDLKHEERVATALASAFIWVAEAARKETEEKFITETIEGIPG